MTFRSVVTCLVGGGLWGERYQQKTVECRKVLRRSQGVTPVRDGGAFRCLHLQLNGFTVNTFLNDLPFPKKMGAKKSWRESPMGRDYTSIPGLRFWNRGKMEMMTSNFGSVSGDPFASSMCVFWAQSPHPSYALRRGRPYLKMTLSLTFSKKRHEPLDTSGKVPLEVIKSGTIF